MGALVGLISFLRMLPERTLTSDLYAGPVTLIVMTLLMWGLIFHLATEGRNSTPRFKKVFGIASSALAFVIVFAGLAFISGDQTNSTLVYPVLHLLHLQ